MDDSTLKINIPEILLHESKSATDNSEILIPEYRDGFYGYNDEKSLQQVRDR